jgi:hypothetical protein
MGHSLEKSRLYDRTRPLGLSTKTNAEFKDPKQHEFRVAITKPMSIGFYFCKNEPERNLASI